MRHKNESGLENEMKTTAKININFPVEIVSAFLQSGWWMREYLIEMSMIWQFGVVAVLRTAFD